MKRARKNERGAAMVEGIVVITSMLFVLGMVLWAYAAWGAKIDQAHQTRSSVLYYASHGCGDKTMSEEELAIAAGGHPAMGGTDESGVAPKDVTASPPDTSDPAFAEANAAATREQPALARHWNMATSVAETKVSGTAIVNLQKFPLETTVKTSSTVACNEKNYGGNAEEEAGYFDQLWNFMINYAKTRGGVGD